MKKLALLICLVTSQISFGQGFLSEDKLWHVKDYSWDWIFTEVFKIEGDTVINSLAYKNLWITTDSAMNDFLLNGFVREESGVVFYLKRFYDEEGVLYDFNLEKGDTASVLSEFCDEIRIVIQETDTVEYFGVPRKRWILDGWADDYWIEGIGSNYGLVYTKLYECTADIMKELTCFHENDTLYYIKEGEVECFQTNVGIDDNPDQNALIIRPNPVTGGQSFTMQCEDGINEVGIFNIYGKKVNCLMFDSKQEVTIPTNYLTPGLYLIKIITDKDHLFSGKIIIR